MFRNNTQGRSSACFHLAFNWKIMYAAPVKYGIRPLEDVKARYKPVCISCEKERCRVRSCTQPLNPERISQSLATFRANKRSRSN